MKTLEDLIPVLIERTKEGLVNWRERDGYKNHFEASVHSKYNVSTWEWEDENGVEGISIGLRPIDATTVIDSIAYDTFSSKYGKIEELFKIAKRKALNLDVVIEEIYKELDDMIPF